MRAILALLVAATLAVPVAAQDSTGDSTPVSAAPADPAHRAAAERVAARIWPDGTWQRQMDSMMDGFFSTMIASIGDSATAITTDMTSDIYGKTSKEARQASSTDGAGAATSAGVTAAEMDRFFQATMRAMGPIMAEIEPSVRAGIAASAARRFTTEQLVEIDGFFSTPTGSAYAAQAMTMLTDPEILQATMQVMPRMIESMPQIMEQVAAETGIPNPLDAQPTAASTNVGVEVE